MTIYLKSNLRYIRKSMGMTQDEFAAKTGMSRSVIGAYEEGRATPSLKRLVELSEMFKVSLDDLVLKDMEIKRHGTYKSKPKGCHNFTIT